MFFTAKIFLQKDQWSLNRSCRNNWWNFEFLTKLIGIIHCFQWLKQILYSNKITSRIPFLSYLIFWLHPTKNLLKCCKKLWNQSSTRQELFPLKYERMKREIVTRSQRKNAFHTFITLLLFNINCNIFLNI